ncbi:hypothetical protein [Microbacterium paraoxydans]|uniref:hypothetical protein n=1 Tax=Microbacterium paraoxydans TaxID=199592 RepID=UPI001CFA7C49|nr:hypothetical protein [Microbacterium paraoxydans]
MTVSEHPITTPLRSIPAWAVLQRRLFAEIEGARRVFRDRYTLPDGRLRGVAEFVDRDGVDDLYEPFFNWPAFYALGGPDEALADAKRHWEGVTVQLTEAGMLTDEYDNGYDWFHQGESLLLLAGICAADPTDAAFAERASRFAALFVDPAKGNYDAERNILRAPHNGALGARIGLDDQVAPYSADRAEMRPYGLPLHGLDGIRTWDDLADDGNATRMADEMQRRADGDIAVNLAATSLAANRWLYDGDSASSAWIERYVDGWRERAAGGLLPDNVGPDGAVGSLQDGRWWGGHYGWAWPHGLHSVGMSALIGALNRALVTNDDAALDLVRTMLDTVLAEGRTASVADSTYSLRGGWMARLGAAAAEPGRLVPYRYGADGWFDFGPLQLDLPMWLWWWTRSPGDAARLEDAIAGLPASADLIAPFRDKEEAGHEAGWYSYLSGNLPEYPVEALEMALGQVARRTAMMLGDDRDPDSAHLHFWQRVNPVVTEVLTQLIAGAPQVLYNGGLGFTALRYEDVDRARPGLPPDVAALVHHLDADGIGVQLVNTSAVHTRTVRLRGGRFGLDRIVRVAATAEEDSGWPGASGTYAAPEGPRVTRSFETDDDLVVTLPPAHIADLDLTIACATGSPRHHIPGGAA